MFTSSTRRRRWRIAVATLTGAAALAVALPAAATPWGNDGADYDGILCRLGNDQMPMGAWTVNGSQSAFSTSDIAGSAAGQGAAPVSGTPSTMAPGQAGFSAADIAAVAYLLRAHQGGSAAELAEVSADVAAIGGNGDRQQRCLGQQGTSAARAASSLTKARQLAGPYRVRVSTQADVIPGRDAEVTVTVLSASGVGVGGVAVTVTAGGTVATVTTGNNGRASATVVTPATASTPVTATASVPNGLTYLDTTPPSVATAPPTTVTGTGALQPVLHPRPTVRVTSDGLVFAGTSVRPQLTVGGTFGYGGTGQVSLAGPVQPASGAGCPTLPGNAPVAWQQAFTFTGDASLRAAPTPQLTAGCYALRATVVVTASSPQERATASPAPITVTALRITAKATGPAALPGGLGVVVTPTDAGLATIRTSVVARGPLPIDKGRCQGDFAAAPIAGTSDPTAVTAATTVGVPDVRKLGCYALATRSTVTLDGQSATTGTSARDATMAVLEPGIAVNTSASSSEQGKPVPGTVQVTGTFGFPGTVAVGVVPGQSMPITGCRDTRFATASTPTTTSRVAVRGDADYDFRTPPPSRIACYSVVATYTLTGNSAVTATSASGSAIFLAGKRPGDDTVAVLQRVEPGSTLRAAVAYGVFGILILVGSLALFLRTFRRNRTFVPGDSLAPLFQ